MDRSDLEAIVARELGPLMGRLGVAHWKVKVDYGPIWGDEAGTAHGRCTRMVDYNSATITLDPGAIEDGTHARQVLRHELFHVVLSPFDLFAGAVQEAAMAEPVDDVLGRVWRHACEKAVINLERMFMGLTGPRETPQ